MKRRIAQLGVIIFTLLMLAPAARADAASLSLSEYRQHIPDRVTVSAGAGEVTVSYHDLKNDLAVFSKADPQKRSALLPQIQNYVHELITQSEVYDHKADLGGTREKLAGILAHREFHNVHGPNVKDVLLARLYRWLSRVLSRLLIRGSSRFNWLQVLVYLLVGAALSLLAVWTIRRLRRREEGPGAREIIPFAPSARGWRTWLAEAHALAQQQDWRNAIHLAYWAGISFLEEHGSWKPNRARTPREYLRMVSSRKPQYPALAALTRKFEIVWYGHRDAAESDFLETLGQLEKLGCR